MLASSKAIKILNRRREAVIVATGGWANGGTDSEALSSACQDPPHRQKRAGSGFVT
jgi:hypothetical protein